MLHQADEHHNDGLELFSAFAQLLLPSAPFNHNVYLREIYEIAWVEIQRSLAALVTRSLTVAPDPIPPWLASYFTLPWYKIYTLDIDNLADAINRRFPVPRTLIQISATGELRP